MLRCCSLSTALRALSLTASVVGYTFQLDSAPQQCGQVQLEVIHGQGKPPYSLLVVPFGPTPSGVPEVRGVFTHNFTDEKTTFALPYPAQSNFVMMLSDSEGLGSGGTSAATPVASSSNKSCLPFNNPPKTDFSFQILPTNAINQCQSAILAWSDNTQGQVNILLLVPGGNSMSVPVSNVTRQQGGTNGFEWVPNVRTGTTIVLVPGDDRGPGSGGSVNIAVGNNPNGDDSCINGNSPSSTGGTAAGAVETGNNGDNGSSTRPGAIAGAVVGGLVGLIIIALLVWFIMRKRKQAARRAQHEVDLLPDGQGPEAELYTPEPFVVPSRSRTASHAGSHVGQFNQGEDGGTSRPSMSRPSMSDYGRRYSALSTDDTQYDTSFAGGGVTESRTTMSRKSPMPPMLRPVNVVQHEDAGEVPEASGSGEPETIELPPAYTSVKLKHAQEDQT